MQIKPILLSASLLLSIILGYIIGPKLIFSEQETADKSTDTSSSSKSSRSLQSDSSEEKDPRAKLSLITQQDDPLKRTSNFLALIESLGPDDFEQVADDFRASGFLDQREAEYDILLRAWAKADPLAAIAYTSRLTLPSFHESAVLSSWAEDDPRAALEWAETSYQGAYGDLLLSRITSGILNTNPTLATEVMNSQPPGRSRDLAMWRIASNVARLGPSQATAWLDSIADESLRNDAASRIAANLTMKDSEASAAWASAIQADEVRQKAVAGVASEWVKKDLPSALAWAQTLSLAEQASAAELLIGPYTREDPERATQWLDRLAESANFENITKEFVSQASINNPQLALEKTSGIQDPDQHYDYVGRIFRRWNQQDAAASEAWLETENVSEEIRESALDYLERKD